MAGNLLYVDSMAHYTDNEQPLKYTTAANTGNVIIAGVNGGKMNAGGSGAMTWTIRQGAQTTVAVGTRFYFNGGFPPSAFKLGNTFSGLLFDIPFTADGRIYAQLDGNANPVSTWSAPTFAFFFLELTATISASVCVNGNYTLSVTYAVYLNGNHNTAMISGTVTGNACQYPPTDLGQFNFSYVRWDGTQPWGDPYVTDGELLGDVVWYYTPRFYDGTFLQWTPKTPGTHFSQVDELAPDGDGSYLEDSTTNDQDSGQLQTIAPAGTIPGMQGVWLLELVSGSGTVKGGYISHAGVNTLTTPNFAPAVQAYSPYLLDPQRKSIFTGLDWTVDELSGTGATPIEINIKNTT